MTSIDARVKVYFAGKEVLVPAKVELFNQNERLKKGAQAFGICWLVGLICVAVPVLHFVLTPMALVAGPFAAFFVYSKVKKLPKHVEGDVACGHCGTMTHFVFHEVKPPLFSACDQCKTGFEVMWPVVD